MSSLIERYTTKIAGTLSCFDRIVVTGTMPGICYGDGMAAYLHANNIRIFDYPKHVEPMRDELRENAERIAAESVVDIEFIRSTKAFRKEDRIKDILRERGDSPGLVHIFSAMEPCASFYPWHDKTTHKTTLKHKDGKCLHYYFYFIDKDFGLCYLRVPTWAPFRLQFYCNGHNWLAAKLRSEGIGFAQMDNTFTSIDDWGRAGELANMFPVEDLHRVLDNAVKAFCPVSRHFLYAYHWSIMQCEWAYDIAFRRQGDLRPIYENISRTAVHAVKCDNVATFLGRKLEGHYKDELGNDFHTRIEGTRVKHHMGPASIKMYDKQGLVLRIETTVNDVTFFRHYRTVEHRDGTKEKKIAPMQKTIYSLPALRECMEAANRRYLEFVSGMEDPTAGIRDVEKLSDPVKKDGRNFPGFNLFNQNDLELIIAISRGECNISGITNKHLRLHLTGKTSPQVSRLLKRLRMHGIIKKAGKSFRYYFTTYGRRVLLTALKLRELVVIPSLAGNLA
jgi:DNA-binding transcriptional ArsR family regulator